MYDILIFFLDIYINSYIILNVLLNNTIFHKPPYHPADPFSG